MFTVMKSMKSNTLLYRMLQFYILCLIAGLSACKPAIGTPWYPRAAGETKNTPYVGSLHVAGIPVTPEKSGADFSEAEIYMVTVPNAITEITAEQIKGAFFFTQKKEKQIADIRLEVEGECVPLSVGQVVPVVVKIIPHPHLPYKEIRKTIKITRSKELTPYLAELKIFGKPVVPGSADVASAENYTVTIPNDHEILTQDDITAVLFTDNTKKEKLTSEIELLASGGVLELSAGVPMPVAIKIKCDTPYASLERFITVTREAGDVNAQYPQLSEIKIHDTLLTLPAGFDKEYTQSPIYYVTVPADKETVKASDVSVILTDDAGNKVDASITLGGTDEELALVQGKTTYLRVIINPVEPYGKLNKLVIITRKTEGEQDSLNDHSNGVPRKKAFLAELKVSEKLKNGKNEIPLTENPSGYTVEVSYQTQFLTPGDFIPSVFTDETNPTPITDVQVSFLNNIAMLNLTPQIPAAVFITLHAGEAFQDIVLPLVITRKAPAEGEVLIVHYAHLTAMNIHGIPVQPNQAGTDFSEAGVYTVEVPYERKTLTAKDITLKLLDEKREKQINGTVTLNGGSSIVLTAGRITHVYMTINPEMHDPVQKLVRVKRLNSGSTEPEETPEEGGGNDDEVLNNTYTPEIIPPGTAFEPRKPATNPKDAAGNYKWIKKIVSGDIDPFDYYQADANGFDASKFDDWVVYISAFEAEGTNVATYTFKDGSWQSDGAYGKKYNGPDFGSGFKAMGNVWFYRYTSRPDRWGGTVPSLHDAEKEKRFYFYRFTASGGVTVDNSMFCVDTHSKFLFYYSDPGRFDSVVGNLVPRDWVDYAQPSSGSHQYFAEPFYMSDPVGYVEADGKVVMYKWIKDNITANNYAAQKNSNYTEVAERKPHKPGHSPYWHKVKGKSAVKWELNPEYTVASVSFKKEPRSQTLVQDTAGWFLQVIPNPAPEGERLSYQWYRNTSESSEGGTPVASGGTDSSYILPSDKTGDFYYYCIVTNTNNKNGKTNSKTTQPVKVSVKPNTAVVTFNCDVAYGSLTASVDGQSIDSGARLKKGTRILFTAEAKDGYRPDVWTGVKRENGKKTAVLFLKDDADVSVSFKRQDVPVDFYCDPSQGVLRASVDGKNIDSGTKVELDKKITFTAEAYPDYRIKSWIGATPDGQDIRSASVTLTKAIEVQAVFEKKPVIAISDETFPIHFSCDSGYGIVDAKAERAGTLPEKNLTDGDSVQKGRKITFTCQPSGDYQLVGWKGADGIPNTLTAVLTVEKETSVEPLFKKKEFAVHFSCDTSRGEVTAQVKGEAGILKNGDFVEKGKTVVFVAEPKPDCSVKAWGGLADTSAAVSKETVVTSEITVSVSFKKSFPVHFGWEAAKGMLKGKALGKDISSGEKLEEGTQVLFTAEAGEDYLIDQWFGLTADAGSSGASITVSENTKPIWLTFKKKTVKVSFSGDNEHGTVTAAVNGKPINSGDPVEKGSVVLFTAKANDDDKYEAGSWSGADGITVYPGNKQASLVVNSNTTVTAAFVKKPERVTVTFNYDSGMGSVTAICDGQTVLSEGKVLKNGSITFLAQPMAGYEVTGWEGVDAEFVAKNKLTAKVTAETDINLTVTMQKIPDTRKLTIVAKEIKNVDMWWDKDYPYTYFVYNLKAKHSSNNSSEEFSSLWNANNGDALSTSKLYQTSKARKIYIGEKMMSGQFIKKTFDSLPNSYQVQFDLQLIKYHDRMGTGVYMEKYLSKYDDSLVTIVYQKDTDSWIWKKIPDKNANQVVIEFPADFVLKRGEEKDFTFKYIGSDSAQYAVGTVEVTYTLKWE